MRSLEPYRHGSVFRNPVKGGTHVFRNPVKRRVSEPLRLVSGVMHSETRDVKAARSPQYLSLGLDEPGFSWMRASKSATSAVFVAMEVTGWMDACVHETVNKLQVTWMDGSFYTWMRGVENSCIHG